MGQKVSREDFDWRDIPEEPHQTRRKLILAKYPQVKTLMGHDTSITWRAMGSFFLQLLLMSIVKDRSWPFIKVVAYFLGATINKGFFVLTHEAAHNNIFGQGRPMYNRFFSFFTNLMIGIPFAASFKRYHRPHHRYLHVDKQDPDLPTKTEGRLFSTTFGKLIYLSIMGYFFALRPLFVKPHRPDFYEVLNTIIQVVFNYIVCIHFGFHVLVYLWVSTMMSSSLHPIAAHVISEHYMYKKWKQGTYSYYGPLNLLTFNIGYHNEHHDFPNIPYTRLPKVRKIAKEFYDDIPFHTSWLSVMYDFVTDPSVGPYARIKRIQAEQKDD